jgi:asparagine synthase (glutamine-hydrolysing)
MCGFYGESCNLYRDDADSIKEQLKLRGEDELNDLSVDDFYLIHSRLAITGTAYASSQPIISPSQRYAVLFNGEIYSIFDSDNDNIRRYGDTIALVNAIDLYGVDECLLRLNGMFSIAIIDRVEKRLTLATDYFGQKPLYYRNVENGLIFGSSGRMLKEDSSLCEDSMWDYLTFGFVMPGRSIYKGVQRLLPGSKLVYNYGSSNSYTVIERYQERNYYFGVSSNTDLRTVVSEAIQDHTYSDFKIALALSGGVDSTLVYGLMSDNVRKRVDAFTIASEDTPEEVTNATMASAYFNGQNKCFSASEIDVLTELKGVMPCLDEPASDTAILSSLNIFKLARRDAKVILLGDGGDELFQGYNRHKLWNLASRFPIATKMISPLVLSLYPLASWSSAMIGSDKISQKLNIFRNAIANNEDVYRFCMSSLAIDHFDRNRYSSSRDFGSINNVDQKVYLPGNNLFRVDRVSLYHMIEARAPLLDLRIAAYAKSINLSLRSNQEKSVLRALRDSVYEGVCFSTRKMGFNIDIENAVNEEASSSYIGRGKAAAISAGFPLARKLSSRRKYNLLSFGMWLEENGL